MKVCRALVIILILALMCSCTHADTPKPQQTAENSPIPDVKWDDGQDYPPLDSAYNEQIEAILTRYGRTIDGIFNYINNEDPEYWIYYDSEDKMDEIPSYDVLAQYILERGHGVCYHYAALTFYLLKASGYDALIIHGYRNFDNALHYWTMVKVDGKWYHFDPLHHQKLLTDSQKHGEIATKGNGLTWESGIWPTTE